MSLQVFSESQPRSATPNGEREHAANRYCGNHLRVPIARNNKEQNELSPCGVCDNRHMPTRDWKQCDECRLIYQDLIENVRKVRENVSDDPYTPDQSWGRRISQAEWAALRSANGWDVWRRLQDHHKLTGHSILKVPSFPINQQSN